jgi:hypothetical protein
MVFSVILDIEGIDAHCLETPPRFTDIGPMTFNHQRSIEWQVCTPPHFNL